MVLLTACAGPNVGLLMSPPPPTAAARRLNFTLWLGSLEHAVIPIDANTAFPSQPGNTAASRIEFVMNGTVLVKPKLAQSQPMTWAKFVGVLRIGAYGSNSIVVA